MVRTSTFTQNKDVIHSKKVRLSVSIRRTTKMAKLISALCIVIILHARSRTSKTAAASTMATAPVEETTSHIAGAVDNHVKLVVDYSASKPAKQKRPQYHESASEEKEAERERTGNRKHFDYQEQQASQRPRQNAQENGEITLHKKLRIGSRKRRIRMMSTIPGKNRSRQGRFIVKCRQDDKSVDNIEKQLYTLCLKELEQFQMIKNLDSKRKDDNFVVLDVVKMDAIPELYVIEFGRTDNYDPESSDAEEEKDRLLNEILQLEHVDAIENDENVYFWFEETGKTEAYTGYSSSDGNSGNLHRYLGQYQDYGIKNVNADKVWENFGNIGGGDDSDKKKYDISRGSNAKVCVLDSGFRRTHFDIDDSRVNGTSVEGLEWDEDVNGHGSHVAGIIGASDNNKGTVGVAPRVNLHIIRVGDENSVFTSNVLLALVECRAVGVNVINMSFGTLEFSQIARDLLDELYWRDNIILVSASGNRGDGQNEITYPSYYESVISVSASNNLYQIAPFSSYNDQVSISGPGIHIYSLGDVDDFVYERKSGTSMSSPYVAGVCALLVSLFPDASSRLIRKVLEYTAHGLGSCGHDLRYGHGHVDAYEAAKLLSKLLDLAGSNENVIVDVDSVFLPKQICHTLTVEIVTDEWPEETFWYIMNSQNMRIFHGGRTTGIIEFQVPEPSDGDCFIFVMTDEYGDG